ncbi:Alpha/Beta hydrolase protein [Obelidium mucronatum]|nr:Alpha/Beta hydrolase protein [Obelidium mucronatum]
MILLLTFWAIAAHASRAFSKQVPLLGDDHYGMEVITHPSWAEHAIHVKSHTTNDPDWCNDSVKKKTGYFESPNGFFFFAFFESRSDPDEDPFILWINGGPGCSSNLGLLMELGPCRVDEGGNSTSFNPYAWNNKANLLFLDQPVGVGFSYAKPGRKVGNSELAAKETDIFLQLFFYNLPQYSKAPVHLFGESYAGHYIPAIGRRVYRENLEAPQKNPNRLLINLVSLGIGNGWVRPYLQFDKFADFLVDEKYGPLVSQDQYETLKKKYRICGFLAEQCEAHPSRLTCIPASAYCERAFAFPKDVKRNSFDVRQKCDEEAGDVCYPIETDIETYLNQKWVQNLIGVDREYMGCSADVGTSFFYSGDEERRYDTAVAEVLEGGVKVLVYAGDADFVCNWVGNEAWLNAMEWSGQEGYLNAPTGPFIVDKLEAGLFKTYGNLTWLKIYGAGHMVPYDKPVESLEMISNWIS